MQQNKLFFDTVYDAIGSDILDAGGYKVVAGKLWPSMKQASAYARLKSCIDEHKDEKLDPEEVHLIAKMAKVVTGSSNYLIYTGQECNCRYENVEPENELEQIERENNELLKQLLKRTERADTLRNQLRAVR